MSRELVGKTVLVTGATGFIGSRLVERLMTVEEAHVRALVRTPSRAVRIARYPVDLVFGNVLDLETVQRAAAGCSVVMHCAYGNSGDAATQQQVTVQGTQNVLQAALLHSVERFVHISTIRVHGVPSEGQIDEQSPLRSEPGDGYGKSKIEAEELVSKARREHGLLATVLRPAFVYGPYSQWWTVSPVQRLKAGEFYFIEGGHGMCNPVYVDDVVQALVLAATCPGAVGEAFVVANDAVTWAEFYGHYLRMVGVDRVPSWDDRARRTALRQRRMLDRPLGKVVARLGSPRARELARDFGPLGAGLWLARAALPRRAYKKLVSQARDLYQAKWWPVSLPEELDMRLFTSRSVYCAEKIRQVLGYCPAVSLAQGMKHTENWLRYAGLL